jgi:hypothetical protein
LAIQASRGFADSSPQPNLFVKLSFIRLPAVILATELGTTSHLVAEFARRVDLSQRGNASLSIK